MFKYCINLVCECDCLCISVFQTYPNLFPKLKQRQRQRQTGEINIKYCKTAEFVFALEPPLSPRLVKRETELLILRWGFYSIHPHSFISPHSLPPFGVPLSRTVYGYPEKKKEKVLNHYYGCFSFVLC